MRYIGTRERLAYGLLTVLALAASLPLYPFAWHTFLHIAGAVVFLGNIIVTAAWMMLAERTKHVEVIHFSAKAVIRADLLFTLPGVLLILMNGFAMVFARWGGWGAFEQITWISVALALFTASGAIWAGMLIPCRTAWLCSLTHRNTRSLLQTSSSPHSGGGTSGEGWRLRCRFALST